MGDLPLLAPLLLDRASETVDRSIAKEALQKGFEVWWSREDAVTDAFFKND
jgi:hypothetical protein